MKRTKLLCLAILFCCIAVAADRPDFSGTWKLNNDKSTADGPADRVFLLIVEQQPGTVKVTSKGPVPQGFLVLDGTFKTDAKPRIAKVGASYRTTTVSWEGPTLVFGILDKDGKKETSKATMGLRESWTLSPNGKVFTRFRLTYSGPKPVDQKYVFEKQ